MVGQVHHFSEVFLPRYEVLPPEMADEVEAKLDAAFESMGGPFHERPDAALGLLIVAEDMHRLMLVNAASDWFSSTDRQPKAAFMLAVDEYKYALRYALLQCPRFRREDGDLRVSVGPADYEAFSKLLLSAAEYNHVVRVFSPYRGGDQVLEYDRGSNIIVEHTPKRQMQYAALELLALESREEMTPLSALIMMFAGRVSRVAGGWEAVWADWLSKAVDRTSARRGHLRFGYSRADMRKFFEDFQGYQNHMPEGWQFPWSSSIECKAYFDALLSLLCYHSIVVHFGAVKH